MIKAQNRRRWWRAAFEVDRCTVALCLTRGKTGFTYKPLRS